jgi:hypothetical protein
VVAAGNDIFASDINAVAAGSTATIPLCIVRKSVLPAAVASGGVALTWDLEDVDTHGWHSTVTNTSRITPTVAGWIRFTATIHFAANATGRRGVGIRVNGVTINYGVIVPGSAAGTQGVTVTRTLPANGTTDYFEAFAFQDSGGALNALDGSSTVFEAEYRRPI